MDFSFFKNKKILVTGHTGFKGTWMCKILLLHGAKIIGYSLSAQEISLFNLLNMENQITSVIGDIRDLKALSRCFDTYKPQIVIHLAAQPLVRESYINPVYTYETNVLGTVNLLEAIRNCDSVLSVVNVTTDKVYENLEWEWGYRENDRLDGHDPYSNSKSCSELVTSSYIKSFFLKTNISISTCRAGNVIGGGDFSKDRIIPDCIMSMSYGKEIIVRNPVSTRPYQHVIEPLFAYLLIAEKQFNNKNVQSSYNVGPDDKDCVCTGDLVNIFCQKWGSNASWKIASQPNSLHEANFLKLDCSKIKKVFNWSPKWHIDEAVSKTVEWSKVYLKNGNIDKIMEEQIIDYLN